MRQRPNAGRACGCPAPDARVRSANLTAAMVAYPIAAQAVSPASTKAGLTLAAHVGVGPLGRPAVQRYAGSSRVLLNGLSLPG